MNQTTPRLRLGIDAGGTFTDTVLIDAAGGVVAAAKSLTTRFDLSVGITASLERLPAERLAEVGLVCLSTTLTTNAVVEGRGAPVCVLLAGYDEAELKRSGLIELLGAESVVMLAGGHGADGNALAPLDEAVAREAISRMAPAVSAFAISGSFGVRNPEHEMQLRAWVMELCDRPVTCGHELSSSLGAPRRAMTAALNARMISYVTALVASVEATLRAHRIEAPLMMVKGDGSLTSAASALLRPVGTVLSGPAASVIGACALSGLQDAVVVDMGGTTTDIAVVRRGRPELAPDGALIGGWRPMIETVRVHAIGLGGDSEVRFAGDGAILIGPRRVFPLSLLGHQHPELLAVLERQVSESPRRTQARFALRLQADSASLSQLTPTEARAWECVCAGPVDMDQTNTDDRHLARALARLERKGLVIYTGFTPTDAAHVLGMSDHWSRPAAELAARIWARQARYVYGYGRWAEGDAVAPAQCVFDGVLEAICHKLIEAGLDDAGQMNAQNASKLSRLLTALVVHPGRHASDVRKPVFDVCFARELPLVAVGAPAASWYQGVARALGVALAVPAHGEVANAAGAALGRIAERALVTVTQPEQGVFRVFAGAAPRDFHELEQALEHAREAATQAATLRATDSGAAEVEVESNCEITSATDDAGGSVFFEARLTAVASGLPRMG